VKIRFQPKNRDFLHICTQPAFFPAQQGIFPEKYVFTTIAVFPINLVEYHVVTEERIFAGKDTAISYRKRKA